MLDPELLAALPFVLRAEVEENVTRKDFTQSELAEIQRVILEHWTAVRKQRQGARTDLTSTQVAVEVGKPKRFENTTQQVAKLFGESEHTVRKRLAIVKAAAAEPDRFGKLLADMDRTGRVDGVYRRLSNVQQAARIRAEPSPLPTGPFRVIVADPPWAFELRAADPSHRGITPYPPMSMPEICALPVANLAHDDALLWLWTTNFHLIEGAAKAVLDAWGFRPKALLTWMKTDKMVTKGRFGFGDWLRSGTEHCIMATRGDPVTTLTNESTALFAPELPSTALFAPMRAHSEKPDEFYALVESLCPAPPAGYVELFARRERPGWVTWGDEVPAIKAAE